MIASPPGGSVSVKEGEEVNLQCEVSGNPLPSVVWSKQVLLSTAFMPLIIKLISYDASCISVQSVAICLYVIMSFMSSCHLVNKATSLYLVKNCW